MIVFSWDAKKSVKFFSPPLPGGITLPNTVLLPGSACHFLKKSQEFVVSPISINLLFLSLSVINPSDRLPGHIPQPAKTLAAFLMSVSLYLADGDTVCSSNSSLPKLSLRPACSPFCLAQMTFFEFGPELQTLSK